MQDLRHQLRVMNEQNKSLLKQLKQNQNNTIEESNQNVQYMNLNTVLKKIRLK